MQPVRGIEQHGPSADGNRQPGGLSVRAGVQENQERLQSETTVDDIIPGIFPSSL